MATKAKTPAKPTAKAPATNGKAISEGEVLAFLELQEKGSDILKKARNLVWRKLSGREPKPELVEVFRQAVRLHNFNECRLAWSVVRKENTPTKAEAAEATVGAE
jgi:hypothetical protein